MPFQPESTLPDLSRLKSQLLTSGVQQSNNPLWQVINQLVDALQRVNNGLNSGTIGGGGSGNIEAGFGIEVIESGGDIIISTSGMWAPLTDGDPINTELIFADAQCIMVFVPEP